MVHCYVQKQSNRQVSRYNQVHSGKLAVFGALRNVDEVLSLVDITMLNAIDTEELDSVVFISINSHIEYR